MNGIKRTALPLLIILLTFLTSCSVEDRIYDIDENDPEMVAAIAKARDTLPHFWRVFDKRDQGESDFCLKLKITDEKGTEHFWVIDIERRDGKTIGTINNDPQTVGSVALGDRINIPEADVTDWLYMRHGKMVGNYTIRPLLKQMSSADVQFYEKMLAEP